MEQINGKAAIETIDFNSFNPIAYRRFSYRHIFEILRGSLAYLHFIFAFTTWKMFQSVCPSVSISHCANYQRRQNKLGGKKDSGNHRVRVRGFAQRGDVTGVFLTCRDFRFQQLWQNQESRSHPLLKAKEGSQ